MVPICRRHLFSIIRLSYSHRPPERQEELTEFLLTHPTIRPHYFKNLYIDDVYEAKHFSDSDYALLHRILDTSSLTSVTVSSHYPRDWNRLDVPEKAKSVILSLIQMPTLRYLTFDQIDNFPATVLSRCSGLDELAFHRINSLTPPGANDAMQPNTITSLVSFTSHSSHNRNNTLAVLMGPIGRNVAEAAGSVIVLDRLTNVSLGIVSQVEFPQMCKFLERAIRLERLELNGEHHILSFGYILMDYCIVDYSEIQLTGLGSSLAANPHPKLRSVTLKLYCIYPGQIETHLSDLNLELRQLSGNNVIEVLEVTATGALEILWSPDAKDWAANFDQLVSDSGAFPALRQVVIGLWCDLPIEHLRKPNIVDEQRYKDYPWRMTEAWFPRLLESTAVRFEFHASIM